MKHAATLAELWPGGPYSRKVRQRPHHLLSARTISGVAYVLSESNRRQSREFASRRSGVRFPVSPPRSEAIRHARAEEEAGRLELLRSGAVGRHAPLAAALLVTIGANLILAVIVIVGLISENLPVAGAVALGLAFLGCGFVFAGLGAVTAQIRENARPSG